MLLLQAGPQQFTSAHGMPNSEQLSSSATERQNLVHQSTQSTSPNPPSLPDIPVTHVHSTTPSSEISIEALSDITRSSHVKNVMGNVNFGSPNLVSEGIQSQHGKSAENARVEFDGAQATPVLDQNNGKGPTCTSLGMSGQIGGQAHYHDTDNAAEGAMVEADRAVAAINAAISFASKARSSQSADSANDQSSLAHPQNEAGIGTDRDSIFFDDDSVYEHRDSEDAGEGDAWPLKREGSQKTNSSGRTSKSISKYNANDLLGSAEKDIEEGPHEGSGKHNIKLFSATHKKSVSLEIFDTKQDNSQGFIFKKGKQERIAETFVDDGQQFREAGFEEDTIQESTSMKGRQRQKPDSVVNHQRQSKMHDEDNLAEQIQERHDSSVVIEGCQRKGDQRRKTKSLVDDTWNRHQEDESNTGLGWKGSDKANLNDVLHYRSDSNSTHRAIIEETHAETFHDSTYSRNNKSTHPMEEHQKQSSIQSLGIGEDKGPQWDEPPKKGTTKSTKPQRDIYYDHGSAPLWNDEPHGYATTRVRTTSAHDKLDSRFKDSPNEHHESLMGGVLEDEHQDYSRDRLRGGFNAGKSEVSQQDEGMTVSDDWYHKSKDDSLHPDQRKTKTKTKSKLSQTSHDLNHDHSKKSVGKEDLWISAAGMRSKSKGDDSQEFESPKLGGYRENHVFSHGDAGARNTKVSNIDIEVKKGSQISDSSLVFDEPEDDILAPRHKRKGSIAKPRFDEFYKGENTRYIDDPGFNKGIRLRGADSEQLKTSRTSKDVDKVHNYEGMIPSSTSRSKQEWPNEKAVRHSSQDLCYPEESKLRKNVNLAGGLPHEQPKHQLRKARDTSSGYDDLNSFGETPTPRVVIVGGKEVRSNKTREDKPYVSIDKETTPRVYDDHQIGKHGEEFPGKKSETKKLPKSRLNDRNDGYGDDRADDHWYPEGSNMHPGLQGDSSRLKKAGALESQGKQSERKKQPKSLDDTSVERWSPNMAVERDVPCHPKGKISNASEYDDHNPPLQSHLGKLKVGKPMSSADSASDYKEVQTPGGRSSRAPKVEKSLKVATASHHEIPLPAAAREVATASHHEIPLPAAAREKSKPAGEPIYTDSRTKQKSRVEPQQKSVAKDEAKASVKPAAPVFKLPPILTGGVSSPRLPKETAAGGTSTPGIKIVKPPDYADFVAMFKRKS